MFAAPVTGTLLHAGVLAPAQVEKLTPASGQRFGSEVSVDGTAAAVAMTGVAGLNTARSRGVFVYRRGSSGWSVVQELRQNDFAREFGVSVSLSGDLLAVGAPYRNSYLNDSFAPYPGIAGRVYLFRRSGTGAAEDWVPEAALELDFATAPNDVAARLFGTRVRLSGDTLVVSMGGDKGYSLLWLYRRTAPGTWVAGPRIFPPDDGGGIIIDSENPWSGQFQIDGDVLLAGPHTGPGRTSQLVVHERNTGGPNAWGLSQRLTAPPTSGMLRYFFSGAMAVGDNRVAARLRRRDPAATVTDPGLSALGFVIYERSGGAGSLFAEAWQAFPAGGLVTSPYLDSSRNELPLGLNGTVLAMAGQQVTPDGLRGKVDLLIKTGTSWSTAFSRTVLAGYRSNVTFPFALSGSTVVTGNDWSSGEPYHTRGVVEIFEGVTSPSLLPLRLILSLPASRGSGSFGNALFNDGNYLIVGDPGDDETFPGSGAVHIWHRDQSPAAAGESWVPTYSLKPAAAATDAHFGTAVLRDTANGSIAIGAPDEPSGGSVYLTGSATGGLTSLIKTGIGVAAGDRFGNALAQWGNFVAIGMPGDDAGGSGSGQVVLYSRSSPSAPWTWLKTLTRPAVIDANDGFGSALSMDDDTLAVAAPFDEDSDADTLDGSVFIYQKNQGGTNNWGLVTTLPIQPSNTTRGIFGYSIALRGDDLIVGSWPFLLFGLGRGEAFLFHRSEGGSNRWGEVRALYQPSFGATPDFGVSVALSGDGKLAFVGADNDDAVTPRRGRLRAFDRDLGGPRQWTLSSTDDPWQPTTEERFGRVVAAGGTSFAVSAPGDDTAGADAGAIYTYRLGSYERWASDTGIVGARSMPPAGDWDNDGVSNLAEFGIGSNPRLGSSREGNLAIRREGDGLLHLRLVKPAYDLTGLTYTVEGSLGLSYTRAPLAGLRAWDNFSSSSVIRVSDSAVLLHYLEDPINSPDVSTHGSLLRLRMSYP